MIWKQIFYHLDPLRHVPKRKSYEEIIHMTTSCWAYVGAKGYEKID